MDEAGLIEEGGTGLAQVGGFGRGRQHQQLRDDAAHPLRGCRVVAGLAGRNRTGFFRSSRGGHLPRRVQGGRVGPEAEDFFVLGHVGGALRGRNSGMGVKDCGLQGSLLRKGVISHVDEAAQLLAPLVGQLLSPQDEGKEAQQAVRAEASADRQCAG